MQRLTKLNLMGLATAFAMIAAVLLGGAGQASAAPAGVTASADYTTAAKTPMQKTADCKKKDISVRSMIACVAKAHLGVKEDGSKKVKAWNCQRYFRDFGSNLNCNDDVNGQWCAAFTRWVWKTAGVPKSKIPASFGVSGWKNALDKVKTPKVGDVAVAKSGSHIMLVTKVDGSKITTIDGNGGLDNVRTKTHTKGGYHYYRMGT